MPWSSKALGIPTFEWQLAERVELAATGEPPGGCAKGGCVCAGAAWCTGGWCGSGSGAARDDDAAGRGGGDAGAASGGCEGQGKGRSAGAAGASGSAAAVVAVAACAAVVGANSGGTAVVAVAACMAAVGANSGGAAVVAVAACMAAVGASGGGAAAMVAVDACTAVDWGLAGPWMQADNTGLSSSEECSPPKSCVAPGKPLAWAGISHFDALPVSIAGPARTASACALGGSCRCGTLTPLAVLTRAGGGSAPLGCASAAPATSPQPPAAAVGAAAGAAGAAAAAATAGVNMECLGPKAVAASARERTANTVYFCSSGCCCGLFFVSVPSAWPLLDGNAGSKPFCGRGSASRLDFASLLVPAPVPVPGSSVLMEPSPGNEDLMKRGKGGGVNGTQVTD
eukprot:1146279-Pelagomonas_calceolata.AAC.4